MNGDPGISGETWAGASKLRMAEGSIAFEFEDGLLTLGLDYVATLPAVVVHTEYCALGCGSEIRHYVFAPAQVPEVLKHVACMLTELVEQGQVRVTPASDAGGKR